MVRKRDRKNWQAAKEVGHEYTPSNTYIYRGRKQCRECNRLATIRKRINAGGKPNAPQPRAEE